MQCFWQFCIQDHRCSLLIASCLLVEGNDQMNAGSWYLLSCLKRNLSQKFPRTFNEGIAAQPPSTAPIPSLTVSPIDFLSGGNHRDFAEAHVAIRRKACCFRFHSPSITLLLNVQTSAESDNHVQHLFRLRSHLFFHCVVCWIKCWTLIHLSISLWKSLNWNTSWDMLVLHRSKPVWNCDNWQIEISFHRNWWKGVDYNQKWLKP